MSEIRRDCKAFSGAIIRQRTGTFDPSTYRDRYQQALWELIETKLKGLPIKPREVITPPPVIDLMAALKRSLAQVTPVIGGATPKKGEPNRQPIVFAFIRPRKFGAVPCGSPGG